MHVEISENNRTHLNLIRIESYYFRKIINSINPKKRLKYKRRLSRVRTSIKQLDVNLKRLKGFDVNERF